MRLMTMVNPWRGGGVVPPRVPMGRMLCAGLGGTIVLAVLGMLTDLSHLPLVLGSFGASCVLVFGYPDSPFSQPRSVMGGHLVVTFIGLLVLHGLGDSSWCLGLATGLAIMAMMALRVVHPPAGSNPVIVFLLHASWPFLLTPTLLGVAVIVVWALVWHRLTLRRPYPVFW